MGAAYVMPKLGGLYYKRKFSLAAGTAEYFTLTLRHPRFAIISVATGILDLYTGNMTIGQQGVGDFRWTPTSGAPVYVPIPKALATDEWTVWNPSDETLVACLIFAD